MPRRAAVFLDRDDTLIANREVVADGDLFDPALVRLLPGVGEGLGRLSAAGFALVVVSNQGSVARGKCGIEAVEATNDRMRELIRLQAGVELDGVYYCPYHPKGAAAPWNVEHPWRKPAPGMILHAAEVHGLELGESWMVGDAQRDIDAALAAGIAVGRTVLVGDGRGGVRAGHRAATLREAAEIISGLTLGGARPR